MAEERSNLKFSGSLYQIGTPLGARVDIIPILISTKGYLCRFTELDAGDQNKPNFRHHMLQNLELLDFVCFCVSSRSPGGNLVDGLPPVASTGEEA